ncbi:MAG: hypothetical protein KF764_27995 [Labilithrix sp.]|nr:hypothetical protein [Labilithrix sp.]
MPNLRSRRSLRALIALSLFVAGTVACAETMSAGIEDVTEDAGTSPPSFTPPPGEAGAGPDDEGSETVDLCIATECPAPYSTCGFSADRCRNNLSNDVDNCGACGNKCPSEIYSPIGGVNIDFRHLAPRCVGGQCTVECNSNDWADCNGRLDDGCETLVKGNPEACGGCGIKCAAGEPCLVLSTGQSKCGCPAGMTFCPALSRCVDLQSDDANCGACGTVCPAAAVDGGAPLPQRTKYGCVGGTCGTDEGHIKCSTTAWADCNGDLPSITGDGCEANVGFTTTTVNGLPMSLGDPQNCGGCGIACQPGQTCALLRQGGVQCACAPGESLCQSRRATWCADLLTSPADCGACGNACANDATKNLEGLCKKGVCVNECAPGWGDCDGNADNGCETNLKTNIAHCGACGNRCATAEGQPCIEGQCLMTECDGGTVTK